MVVQFLEVAASEVVIHLDTLSWKSIERETTQARANTIWSNFRHLEESHGSKRRKTIPTRPNLSGSTK